ncbi:GGDEF domain-containing protein [Phytopseudomonas flavescens]|uniref:GGDEF domain-containing protein n=1 Tax=Phytopseudomonas flavescens TaxID=29435 RepID=UPI001428BC6A|nr:GGDEF domain-containing protein [Pseudomonas flavescens]
MDKWINTTLVVVSLGILLSFLLIDTDFYKAYRAQVKTLTQLSVFENALRTMEAMSTERGPTNGMLGGLDGDPQRLLRARTLSDERLHSLTVAISDCQPCEELPYRVSDISEALEKARANVDSLLSQPVERRDPASLATAVSAMIAATEQMFPLIDWLSRDMVRRTPQISATLFNTYWAAHLREIAGQWGSQLTSALAEQRPVSVAEARQLQTTEGRIVQLQMQLGLGMDNLPSHFDAAASRELKSAYANMHQVYRREGMEFHRSVVDSLAQAVAPSPAAFAERYVPTMASILALRDTALRLTKADLQRTTRKSLTHLLLVTGSELALLLLLGAGFLWFRRRVIKPLVLGTHKIMTLVDSQNATQPGSGSEGYSVFETLHDLERQLRQAHALRRERDELITELKANAETDHLTGLPNRRAFDRVFYTPGQDDNRHRTIILFDIDHFKRINDTYGHPAGDRLLQLIAARCQAQMRGEERIARIGGEEFAIQLWLSSAEAALHFAERIRCAISDAPFDLGLDQPIEVTASFGIAQANSASRDDVEKLRARADEALYRAKRSGRNRSELAI